MRGGGVVGPSALRCQIVIISVLQSDHQQRLLCFIEVSQILGISPRRISRI